jgi:hypothetical protein
MLLRSFRALRLMGGCVPLLSLSPSSALAESITGVCPDGSIYIVQHESQIPCRGSKEVDPLEIPPIRPQYLPNPYTWQVYQQLQDPNNPYNLIDSARQIRAMQQQQATPGTATESLSGGGAGASSSAPGGGSEWDEGGGTPAVSAPPPQVASREPIGPLDLGLGDQELRDLYQIVELSQESTPAAFERRAADGKGVMRLSLARSAAFQARLLNAWSSRGGLGASQVLLFTAVSKQPETFHPNLTFVQDHLTFQPDDGNPRQLGILQGRLGKLQADEVVLGYVILPETLRVTDPMDVFWDDRRIAVQFPQ